MEESGKNHVIIVAGGIGSRMNNNLPKQFIEVKGVPVVLRTIRRFLQYDPAIGIVVVVHPDFLQHMEALLGDEHFNGADIRLTSGGATRFASVKNGLDLIAANDAVVGIHDAARPFVSLVTIRSCFETAAQKGSAVPCVAVNESLRELVGGSSRAVNRALYRIVQTPQCFTAKLIKAAFDRHDDPAFTDDATVFEAAGGQMHLVEGNVENIKITTPQDLLIADLYADE